MLLLKWLHITSTCVYWSDSFHKKSKILIANNYYFQKECEKRGAFQSTVVIQSNSRDPDSHVVTHTLTDLVDGTTSTLYGKKVHASDVISAHYSQY